MSDNENKENLPSQEQLRKILAHLWPELAPLVEPAKQKQDRPGRQKNRLNEEEIDELVNAIEPPDQSDLLSPEEMEQVLQALASIETSSEESPSPSPTRENHIITEEEKQRILQAIKLKQQPLSESTQPLDHQSPLSEQEVEKLIQALSKD